MRALLEVPGRFRKRDGNALSTASSRLEKEKRGQPKFGDEGEEFQRDAQFWVYSCFPHDALRGARESSKEKFVLNGLGETRGVMSEQWRAGGRKARRTRCQEDGINPNQNPTYMGWITYGDESLSADPGGEQECTRLSVLN